MLGQSLEHHLLSHTEFTLVRDYLLVTLLYENVSRPGPLETGKVSRFQKATYTNSERQWTMVVDEHKTTRENPPLFQFQLFQPAPRSSPPDRRAYLAGSWTRETVRVEYPINEVTVIRGVPYMVLARTLDSPERMEICGSKTGSVGHVACAVGCRGNGQSSTSVTSRSCRCFRYKRWAGGCLSMPARSWSCWKRCHRGEKRRRRRL